MWGDGVVADCEQQGDALGLQASGHERQRVRGRSVQPVRVVDQAQQRPVLGHLGQQTEHRDRHQEPVPLHRRPQSERAAQRRGLAGRDRREPVRDGAQQLVRRRVRELGLRLDPAATQHPHTVGP